MISATDYRLRVSDTVAELLGGLHPQLKVSVKAALKMVVDDPYSGKPLKDELDGLRSMRVKRFRIVYRLIVAEKEVEIVAIGPRKPIYEETYCILNKGQ